MIQHELLQFLDKTEQILIGWLRLELANSDDRGQRSEGRKQKLEFFYMPFAFFARNLHSQPVNQTRST
jgi:hypothetical protein